MHFMASPKATTTTTTAFCETESFIATRYMVSTWAVVWTNQKPAILLPVTIRQLMSIDYFADKTDFMSSIAFTISSPIFSESVSGQDRNEVMWIVTEKHRGNPEYG